MKFFGDVYLKHFKLVSLSLKHRYAGGRVSEKRVLGTLCLTNSYDRSRDAPKMWKLAATLNAITREPFSRMDRSMTIVTERQSDRAYLRSAVRSRLLSPPDWASNSAHLRYLYGSDPRRCLGEKIIRRSRIFFVGVVVT